MTDSSVLIPSTVHVLSTMGLTDVQLAVALPPTAPPVHPTTAM